MNIPVTYLPETPQIANAWYMANVAHYRKLRGLTQTDLAEMIGTSQPHISRIERGDEGPPLEMFRKIAEALDVPLSALFSEEMEAAELILLEAFRNVPRQIQQSWLEMARVAAAQPQTEDQ